MNLIETTKTEWAPCALLMPMSDYELIDYLMACMAYDMGEFSASPYTAEFISYLVVMYGDDFTLMGHNIYKYHLTEIRNAR